MIRIYKSGRHSHRSPLSYPALADLFAGEVTFVDTPAEADLYLFAHILDVRDTDEDVVLDWRARKRPVILLSEEPFWDTIWGRAPLQPEIYVDTRFGDLPVIQLTHATTGIFNYAKLPYYILTNHRFINAYRARFARNARLGATEWQVRFAAREVDTAFMFERRPERFHDAAWPAEGIYGLCAWRTDLAEACQTGQVERLGRSWQGGATRWEALDWHVEKLVQLDNHARSIGAIENTHQPNYLTEKLFDAFACGARPLYFASDSHRMHRMKLPGAAWLNLFGLDPADAAEKVAEPFQTPEFFEAYREAQARLAALFGDAEIVTEERARLRGAVLDSLIVHL